VNTADRRERVAQLVAKGWSSARLAEHFGVTQRTINYDCRELGITQEKPPPADTVERRESVAKLTRQGVSVREIADRLKISTRTVERDRAATGVAPVTPRWTDDEHQRALRLLADGASLAEVSRTLSRSYDRTYRRYKGMGWTSAQTGAHNSLRTKLGRLLDD
jgi:DNA-binding CsgD family transcriptional regulator